MYTCSGKLGDLCFDIDGNQGREEMYRSDIVSYQILGQLQDSRGEHCISGIVKCLASCFCTTMSWYQNIECLHSVFKRYFNKGSNTKVIHLRNLVVSIIVDIMNQVRSSFNCSKCLFA